MGKVMPRPLRYRGRLNRRARNRLKSLRKLAGGVPFDMRQGSVARTLRELLLTPSGARYLRGLPFAGPNFRALYRELAR